MPGDVLTEMDILMKRMTCAIQDIYFLIDFLEDRGLKEETGRLVELLRSVEDTRRDIVFHYFWWRRDQLAREIKGEE